MFRPERLFGQVFGELEECLDHCEFVRLFGQVFEGLEEVFRELEEVFGGLRGRVWRIRESV